MNILVFGAGVIGTLYAARLAESGHGVTVLARGQRLADIRRHGLVIEDIVTGRRSEVQVHTIERLDPADRYDVALVTVRRDQVADVLPELAANRHIPTLLFMLNNATGPGSLVQALGRDRVLLGFPGAGGTREGHVVRYAMIAQQSTTLGELSGQRTPRLRQMLSAFRESGFPATASDNMDAWLKTHAFFVTAVSGAIYLSGGDCRRLSRDGETLKLMTNGVREGFAAVRALGLPVTPFPLKVLFTWLPPAFAIRYWGRFLAADIAEYVFGGHARIAAREMHEIAGECRVLLDRSGVDAPALRKLYGAIDARSG